MTMYVETAVAVDFADYVAAQRKSLLRSAYAITRDRDSAEDLLQTALTSVYSRWDGIRDRGATDAYVRRAMVNQYASWFRQKWRTQEWATDEIPEPEPRWSGPGCPAAATERQQLWPLVTALPPGQRSAVVLRYFEDLSEVETAAALRCSVGTVKSSTSRGLAALRRLVQEADAAVLAS